MASKAKRRPSWKKNHYRLFDKPGMVEALQETRYLAKLLRNASKHQMGTKSSDIAGRELFTFLETIKLNNNL